MEIFDEEGQSIIGVGGLGGKSLSILSGVLAFLDLAWSVSFFVLEKKFTFPLI